VVDESEGMSRSGRSGLSTCAVTEAAAPPVADLFESEERGRLDGHQQAGAPRAGGQRVCERIFPMMRGVPRR
jgi:hypothetical protein